MNSDWIELQVPLALDSAELLGLLDDPAVAGAWQENGEVRLYWPKEQWKPDTLQRVQDILRRMGQAQAGAALAVRTIPAQDWNKQWAQSVKPIRIGRRIVIRPSWERTAPAPGDVELILDPKQAFGTGHHATTALLIEWLEAIVRGGERVLDVGTGSGILAMAALRLGAKAAVGIDCDPVAIECAREYATVNGFGPELEFRVATLDVIEPVPADLVLANLDRNTLLASSRLFEPYLKRGAKVLVSGLLREDRADLAEAFAAIGGVVSAATERDGWLGLEILTPDSCAGGA